MVADKSFGLMFLDVFGAMDAHILYPKRFGGPPDGKNQQIYCFVFGERPWWEPLKLGTGTVNTDL